MDVESRLSEWRQLRRWHDAQGPGVTAVATPFCNFLPEEMQVPTRTIYAGAGVHAAHARQEKGADETQHDLD